jgi:hypothetical protein
MWLEWRLRQAPEELNQLGLEQEAVRQAIREARKILQEARNTGAFRELDREMAERRKPDHVPTSKQAEAELLASELKRALDLLRPHVEKARRDVAALSPMLSELAQALAKQADQLAQQTRKHAEEAKNQAEASPKTKTDAAETLAQQEQLNERVESLKDMLRADANQQSIVNRDQRERARDADDALAMLKEPPPKAAHALEDAAKSQTQSAQEQALTQAAEQQEKLEHALADIAKHYEALEQDKDPQDTRAAMRAAESQLGVKETLDRRYARAEQLANMAEASPQELLRQLEQALPQNPLMQQELDNITQNALTAANQKLAQASHRENEIAQSIAQMAQQESPTSPESNLTPIPENLPAPTTQPERSEAPPESNSPAPKNPQLAESAKQQQSIAQMTAEAGADVSRAGRHQERLQNQQLGRQLQEFGQEIAETSTNDIPTAEQALNQARAATQAQKPVASAAEELARESQQLAQAAQGGPLPTNHDRNSDSLQSQPLSAPTPNSQETSPSKQANASSASSTSNSQNANPSQQPAHRSPSQSGQKSMSSQTANQSQSSSQTPGNKTALTPVSPQEQVWMARTLDALDAALTPPALTASQSNSQQSPPSAAQQGQQNQLGQQPGSQTNQSGPPGQKQTQAAMQQTAMAAAHAARGSRSQSVSPVPNSMASKAAASQGDPLERSTEGALAEIPEMPYGAVPDVRGLKTGEWGKLPKLMAEQLSRGQSEAVASEYQSQVETYYRVIAERAKKP